FHASPHPPELRNLEAFSTSKVAQLFNRHVRALPKPDLDPASATNVAVLHAVCEIHFPDHAALASLISS
ncbi:hypothetical protein R0K20_25860, partial [Staphylococcus sp. SIMBA_130]